MRQFGAVLAIGNESCGAAIGTDTLQRQNNPRNNARRLENMFGFGIIGTILIILLVLWLLGVL